MRAYLFSISMTPLEEIRLPRFQKGNVLRGAFGQNLRRLVCVFHDAECEACRVSSCPYRSFFHTMNGPNAEKLSTLKDIPRPYVIKPPLEQKEVYRKGEEIMFRMIVFGKAIVFLPHMIAALSDTAERGLGKFRGRAKLKEIVQENPVTGETSLLLSSDGTVRVDEDLFFTEKDFPERDDNRVTVRFLTPTIIKDGNVIQRRPSFRALVERLRDRFSSLSWFYENEEPYLDFRAFAEQADKVRIADDRTYFVTSTRLRRDGTAHDMSGVIGSLTYEGPVGQYLPYLSFGQYMHVGKSSVFGNGWYEVRA